MKGFKALSALLLIIALLAGCTGKNPLDLIGKPVESPDPLQCPGVVPMPDDMGATPSPEPSPAPGGPDYRRFGRYAAGRQGTLFFGAADSVIAMLRGGVARQLCAIPEDQALEDLFAADADTLYFSTISTQPSQDGYTRRIYRATVGEGAASAATPGPALSSDPAGYAGLAVEVARSRGPMLVRGQMIYYMFEGRLMALDTAGGKKQTVVQLGDKAQLFGVFGPEGNLYYSVYQQMDSDGTLFGQSKLYRLGADGSGVFIAEMDKPFSNEFIRAGGDMLYQIKSSEDARSYNLRVIDSPRGGSDRIIRLSRQFPENHLGSEYLYWMDGELYMLVTSTADLRFFVDPASGDAQNGDSSKKVVRPILRAYRLNESGKPAQVWSEPTDRPVTARYPFIAYHFDPLNRRIVALAEGEAGESFRLFALDPSNGEILQTLDWEGDSFLISKALVDVGGVALVYSTVGEDYPRPLLECGIRLSDFRPLPELGAPAAQ